MNMLDNSGSYYIMQLLLFGIFFLAKFVNAVAKRYPDNKRMRSLGIRAYESSIFSHFFIVS